MASNYPDGSATNLENLPKISKEVKTDDNEPGRDTGKDYSDENTNNAENRVDKEGKSKQDFTIGNASMHLDQNPRQQLKQNENIELHSKKSSCEFDQDIGSKSDGCEKQDNVNHHNDTETKREREQNQEDKDNKINKQSDFVESDKQQNKYGAEGFCESGFVNNQNLDDRKYDENQTKTTDLEGTNNVTETTSDDYTDRKSKDDSNSDSVPNPCRLALKRENLKTGSEGKDNKAVELVEFKTGSEGKDNKAVELVELKTGSEGKDNKAVELVELKTGSEGTDNKAVELVEFFKNLSIKDQPRSNNDSESYKSLHGAIKSTYPKVIKQQKIENENMNNQTSYQTTSGSPCSTEKPMTKFEKENNKSPKSDKASEKSFEESHKTDSFRMIESSPRSIRKIINSAPEEQSKAFTDKQQQQQQESMQPHHPADNLAGKQQQQQSLQHHPPESNLADKQQQQQSMQPHHPADNMTGKQQQQSMQPHHPADNLTGKRQQQQSMQPHHPADMAGKQQQQSMQPHHPADNLAGKRQQQQSMQPHHPADNLADKQQQQQSLQSQPPADNFADKQQQQRFLQCQPPADTLADKQQQQQQSLQHHPPADNFADEQQQQQRSLQCQPPADNFADKQQQQQCVQSQPLTGNGAHGYYTRSKSQEEKMDTHLKGNGTHGYYTRSRSQEEGKMDTYTKGNGAHGYYTKSKSQEEKMDKHFKGKESSFNTTSQQKDIENQQTFYKVHLFFENNDSLLEIPCSQKQYYQWTFIVVAVNAEFFDSLKKYPGCKIFKQEHSNKCLTLVCENDVKPDDLKQMIHYLFVEYSKTINAVYQADIPDPKRVCELAEKKIENCKKGIVKIFCGEMTGLWIVGYNQHVYAVTKEIHDLIEKISTKCFDAAEKIDDFGSRYTPKVNEDMSQPQSDKPPNDRCMDIIDEFKFEVIKRFEIITNLRKKYPGMKITVTDTKVVFEGSPEVNSAYSDYMKEMESIKKSETDVSLSIRCMDLLHSKEVLSFIQQEVAVTHWLKIISNNHFVMYGRTKKDAKSAVKCLSDLILEKEIKIDPFYWKSEDMVTERHKFERLYGEKLKLYADSDDEKRNYIVATKDIMSSVLAGLKEKKKQLTKTCVKHVDSTDHSCFQFLNETQKLLDVASRYSVQVSPISRKEKCGWKVEGPDLNVRFCTDEVELLKKSIKKRSEKFESEKVGNFFESNLGSDFLRTVEQKNNCWIETENESYQEAVYGAVANKRDCTEFGLWKYQKSNKMIRLVCGVGEACGTEMLVDVVPGSNKRTDIKYTTELSKIVKVKLSVPVWIDGSHKERDTFCTMLNELFIGMIERGCKTVAFPFEISDEIKWNNIQFIKLVTFELNQFKLQNESVLYCTFFHPDPDRCKIAENAIDQILKTVIKDGSVEKSRSNEFYSHASTKLDMAAAGEYKYPIQIVLGELAVQQADVIVNTTSNSLALNTGHVSASIFKMGGQAIQDECNQYIKKGFSIDYGNFVETNGCGQLKCKKVYHCVLSQYIQSGVKNLQKIMRGCLEEADKSKMRSICFPAFGTGNLGFPKHISAEYMFKSTEDFFDAKGIANTSVRDVRFVIYNKDQSTIEAFRKEEQKRRNSSSVLMPVEIATDKVQFSFAKNLTLCVSQGEISNSKTDALIVFWSLNEVFNNIVPREYLQKIGESFEKEWSKKSKNLASQKCIETSAGNLGFKKIIHQLLDESKMSSGILTALKKVESSHFRSVSVALLRADPLARLAEKYAKAFNGAVKDFVSQMSKTCQLEFLQIVISDDKIYNKFKNELKALRQQKGTEVKYPSSTKANDKAVYYKKKTIVHVTVTSDTKENIDNAVKSIEKKVSSIEDISKEGQKLYPGKAVPFKKTTVTNTSFDQEDTKHTDNGSSSNEKTPFLPSQDLKQRVQLIKTKVERCRLLVHMKTNSTIQKDPSIFKLELSQMIKLQKAVSIVYPFADYRSCLLKFISPEDADHCLTSWKNSDCPYGIKPFPPQVIVNIQAEISSHILHRIEQNGCLDKLNMIEKESGAELKILESCYVLEGSLIDIGIATEIIASWINDETDRSDVEQLNVTSGQQKQDCFSSVEERNPGMLVKKPDTEKIECTLDHFKILKELKLIKDFSALKTERSTLNDKLVSIEGPVDHIRALKCTFDDISKWPKEEILLSTFPETDMSKINQVCQDISQNLPDLCIRQQENKIVVAGKYYEKVQNAKLKINLAIGRVKTTGRGERVISNPDYNSSKDLSQQSELLPEKSTFIQASTSSAPINANIFETKEGISVYIYTGDILVSNVDCIVNNKFNHKGEIAADITKQAGEEVVQQYDRYIKQNSPFQRAKICKTTAGNLKYKYILHVVGPHWGDNISASKCRENLLQAVSDCLLTAEELKMSSIAIPGIYKVQKDVCASVYLESVTCFITKYGSKTSLKEIHFVEQNDTVLQYIVNVFSTCQNFCIRKMKIPAENDMPAKRSDRKKFLPPVPVSHQQTKTLYPYHVMEKNEKYDVHLFHISKSLTVKIHTGDIIKANTSAIVSTEDNKFSGEGEIAKGILKTAGSAYGQEHKELQKIMHNELEIEETNAGDLHFIKVYHVVIPTPKQKMNKTEEERYFNIVSSAVQSVLVRAETDGVLSLAMDLIGKGKFLGLEDQSISCLTSTIMEFSKQHVESKLSEIVIIDLYDTITNRLKNAFLEMIQQQHGHIPDFQSKEKIQSEEALNKDDEKYYLEATEPYGTMNISVDRHIKLKGHEDSETIVLEVFFPDENTKENKSYKGLSKTFYLPNSSLGNEALFLLKKAFQNNKLFHVGYWKKTGKHGVTYSGIHLKSNIDGGKENFGYPDQNYLDILKQELASVGVFKKETNRETTV